MPVRRYSNPVTATVYFTVICDRCLRIGPTRLTKKDAFIDGGFFMGVDPWGAPIDEVVCAEECEPVLGLPAPSSDEGHCPACGYAYTRYDRILDRPAYVPGEPCPQCGEASGPLPLSDDTRHIERVVRTLPDDVRLVLDRLQLVQAPRTTTYRWSRNPRDQLSPGSVWRGREGRLFAVLNQCIGEAVDVTIDPHEPSGRRTIRFTKDQFTSMFECVAVPSDEFVGDDEPTLEIRHGRHL